MHKKTITYHLDELRFRLTLSIIGLIIGSTISFFFQDKLVNLLLAPLHQPIYYTSPAGGFTLIFTTSLIFGLLISLPFLMYQLYKFIEPALPQYPKQLAFILIVDSCFLMLLGIGFAYYISLPAALHFLGGFSTDKVKSLITAQEYFSFVSRYVVGFGIMFQLPLVMLLVNALYPLRLKGLLKFQQYVIVLSFIAAAILTPTPDPINQTIMAIPIIILYYASLLLIAYVNKSNTNLK
jgi:sec-independent protein translocase protein TatC